MLSVFLLIFTGMSLNNKIVIQYERQVWLIADKVVCLPTILLPVLVAMGVLGLR